MRAECLWLTVERVEALALARAASTRDHRQWCRQVPMAISTLSAASEAPTISPETMPHSNHQHLSSELDC
jgi:hypothetical protein